MKQEMIIGRGAACDIVVPRGAYHDTVSSRHAGVSPAAEPGMYDIADLDSSNGLFVWQQGAWCSVSAATISPDTPLRLGLYETSLADLDAAFASPGNGSARHPYRHPLTGEIIG